MIACSDLRIGNYVQIHTIVRQVASVSSIKDNTQVPAVGYYIGEDLHFLNCDSEQLQAAPLNNSLLEKCGFVFDNYFHLWQKRRPASGTGMEMELDLDYNVVDFMRRPILKKITSMHVLQNLYYALLGKELAIMPSLTVAY